MLRPKTFRLSFIYTNSRVVILVTVWPGISINWEDTCAGQEIAKAPSISPSIETWDPVPDKFEWH